MAVHSRWGLPALGALVTALSASWAQPVHASRPSETSATSATTRSPSLLGAWAEFEAGAESLHLRTLAVDQAAGRVGFIDTNALVPIVGVGTGLRLSIVTIGPRVRLARADGFDLWSLGGELGVRVPLSIFEPYVELGGGQATLANVKDADAVAQGIAPISGYYARLGAGLGVRPNRLLEISARATWEFLGLAPSGASTGAFESIGRDVAMGRHEQAWAKGRRLGGMGYGSALGVSAALSLRF